MVGRQVQRCELPVGRRVRRPVDARYSLPPDTFRILIVPKGDEGSVPEVTVGRPFDETNLCDEVRLQPAHLGHLLLRHAPSPVGSAAGGQIDERTPPGMQSVELSENVGACMRGESSPDLRREDQICVPSSHRAQAGVFGRIERNQGPRTYVCHIRFAEDRTIGPRSSFSQRGTLHGSAIHRCPHPNAS